MAGAEDDGLILRSAVGLAVPAPLAAVLAGPAIALNATFIETAQRLGDTVGVATFMHPVLLQWSLLGARTKISSALFTDLHTRPRCSDGGIRYARAAYWYQANCIEPVLKLVQTSSAS